MMDAAAKVHLAPTAARCGNALSRHPEVRRDALFAAPRAMKFTTKMWALLLFAAVLLVAGSALSLWTYRQIGRTGVAEKQALSVLSATDDFLSALKDAETGQRGFLLTGNEDFLQPYLSVRDGLQQQLQQLQQLQQQSDAEASREQLAELTPLVHAKLGELQQVIDLRRAGRHAEVLEIVNAGEGKRLMDAIRSQLQSFRQHEEAALAQHAARYQANLRNLFALIVAASLLGLLGALGFAYLIYRQGLQRQSHLLHLQTRHLLERQEQLNQQLQDSNRTLQISEEQLTVTLSSIGDGVITTDAQSRVTSLNPLAEQLTGWAMEAARGQKIEAILRIVNKTSRQLVVNPVLDALLHGTVQGLANHTVLIARDGREYDIADSCAPIRTRDGVVIGAVLVFRDVTEEYAVQQQARDSTVRMQTILSTVVDGILTLHGQTMVVETVNPSVEKMFGYTALDMLGQHIRQLIPDFEATGCDRTAAGQDEAEPAAAPGNAPVREAQGRRQDGSSFPLELSLNMMWLAGERHYTASLRDLSARKQTEDALIKAGALQAAIFNSANFSSIATDAQGVIQIFNVGAERMLGYAAVDVMNKITPAEISDPLEIIARAKTLSAELGTPIAPGFEALVFKASRGIEDIYELTYLCQDGSRLPAVVSVTALRDAAGAIIGYLLIGTDNTARKQIEAEQKLLAQRLRDQQYYTRSLFESNVDAIMTTDPQGIITDVNQQMEVLTGCTRDELIGAPFKSHFTDPERAEMGINRVLSEKKVRNYELTARSRDGLETVVSYNATTFYDRERTLQGVFAAARDITERKRFDRVLEEKTEELESARTLAEKANRAKSDFLSSMSHELRSPLNAILGFAQLLESESPPPTQRQLGSILQILRAGWHLLKLINEILDLTKIESGQVPLSSEPVRLDAVLAECRSMFEPMAQQRGVSLVFPEADVPHYVMADHTRLKQVFINLLSNAIKYNLVQGTVAVSCALQPNGQVRVSIRDTGLGLREDQQAQLFQAFNRLGQEGSGVEGTGIGLVVAKQLVELMEGAIGVQSRVGEGSVFWFELPAVAAPVVALDASHLQLALTDAPGGVKTRTLLYVEDNPANMTLVQKIIERYPSIHLLTATDGLKGLAMARAALPDVILLDINLPGISGFETLKLLREDPLTAHIPALAISANAMQRDIKKGEEAGFLRYLTKPIKVDEFMLALNAALELSQRQRP
jgi:PAS domain S-box-containing protein